MRLPSARNLAVLAVAVAVLAPLGLLVYQSFLDAPFFNPSAKPSFAAYQYVLVDPDFHTALATSIFVSTAMVIIAVPIGSLFAFLLVRSDMPGRRVLEPLVLIPIFLSPVVLAFGYVVAAGPVGFFSLWAKGFLGVVPWNVYSVASLAVIAGLAHVPHIYLYASTALRTLNPDVEEAARTMGAGPLQVALAVSLPLIWPSLVFGGALVFLLGFELFGLPLVLGGPAGVLVLTTYLYKLTNILGTPSYHLMAVVAVVIVAITMPLVILQRRFIGVSARYVTLRGRGQAVRRMPLGSYRWPALLLVVAWLGFTVVVPLAGVALRSVVSNWGEGVNVFEVLTLDHFAELGNFPNLVRGIVNTLLIATIGGAAAVACYAGVALAVHRWQSRVGELHDFLVLIPRAIPGIVVGLAFLWLFLFFRPLSPLRNSPFSLWIAYTVVWLAYGLRLITAALLQIGPELEEAGRVAGASTLRVYFDTTLPLIRFGLLGSWLLIFMMFVREYSTGVYLLAPGAETIGSLIVSLWGTGALDLIAALSVINIALVGAGLAAALRLGVRVDA